MTRRPQRIVDAHVHLWDPAQTTWYPYLSGASGWSIGDPAGMARRFDLATYRAESAGWNVEKLVNVAAATGDHSIDETLEMERRAAIDGHPDVLIGGIVQASSVAESLEQLDRQMAASRFRGVRPMGRSADPLPAPEVLAALQERGLVFELLAHPDQLEPAARCLAAFDGLTVVVEHAGWPRTDAADERALWARGLQTLADLGDHVVCKVSGLAMPLGSLEVEVLRPWVEQSIATFGVDRCLFASNFPVDGAHGTLDQLLTTFSELTATLDDAERDGFFAGNAERVYRC